MLLEALTLLAIGDSLTSSCCHAVLVPPPVSWAEQIGAVNVARGGSASFHWDPDSLGYYWNAQAELPADVALVLLGSNDAGGWFASTPDEYYDAMSGLVDGLLDDGAGRVVLLIPPDTMLDRPDIQERLDSYRLVLEDIAASIDRVQLGPDLRDVLQPQHYTAGDLIHPNDAGQAAIADAVEAYLVPEVTQGVSSLAALGVLVGLNALQRRRGERA